MYMYTVKLVQLEFSVIAAINLWWYFIDEDQSITYKRPVSVCDTEIDWKLYYLYLSLRPSVRGKSDRSVGLRRKYTIMRTNANL